MIGENTIECIPMTKEQKLQLDFELDLRDKLAKLNGRKAYIANKAYEEGLDIFYLLDKKMLIKDMTLTYYCLKMNDLYIHTHIDNIKIFSSHIDLYNKTDKAKLQALITASRVVNRVAGIEWV